ncbi:hypothetical protein MTR_8g017230 [Medicago truncatula]|uniref:Uncharacterized protein n=1 Tax=Medicago truncatula TaxID=3880 RepID=G7LHH1_MEDTR|nr:hypothetical protein MTR_8g017230 [Medicago truncatula]
MDVAFLVKEVVDLAKKKKEECLILKVDIEKAGDSISWSDMWTLRHDHTDFCWVLFILCNKDVGGT